MSRLHLIAAFVVLAICVASLAHNRHLKRCGDVVIKSDSSCGREAAFLRALAGKISAVLDHWFMDPAIRARIRSRWDGTVHELEDQDRAPAVSTQKREIRLCLKGGPTQEAALFVLLHEMAHIGCTSTGHTDEFWRVMRHLLDTARAAGVYTTHDASSTVCGTAVGELP